MKSPSWNRTTIKLSDGTVVPAIEPLIISASRATDIPALYADRLLEQFKNGYVRWVNPFNGKQQFVSLSNVEIVAFWSKNPLPLIRHLDYFDRKNIGYFFQFTINDYEKEGFEPGVPPLARRIETAKTLSAQIGSHKILWRFDPLIITQQTGPTEILAKIERVGDSIAPYVDRLTVSFLSLYPRVVHALRRAGIEPIDRTGDAVSVIGEGLRVLSRRWQLPIFTCAESADLSTFGIVPGSCIDPVYLMKVFPEHATLSRLIANAAENTLFTPPETVYHQLKDPGQRHLCRCMISKDIGRYASCTLGCRYCYAGGQQHPQRMC